MRKTTSKTESILSHIIGRSQLAVMTAVCRGEEGEWFRTKMAEIETTFATMPRIYGQDGLGKRAIVYMHYFTPSGDWYITERDTTTEQHQAFDSADLGYNAELGYISIAELIANGAELDLHWAPRTLAEVMKK